MWVTGSVQEPGNAVIENGLHDSSLTYDLPECCSYLEKAAPKPGTDDIEQ